MLQGVNNPLLAKSWSDDKSVLLSYTPRNSAIRSPAVSASVLELVRVLKNGWNVSLKSWQAKFKI